MVANKGGNINSLVIMVFFIGFHVVLVAVSSVCLLGVTMFCVLVARRLVIVYQHTYPTNQAPFPFVVGIQYKTAEIRSRCAGIARVNVYKNRVKMIAGTPQLPGHSTLVTKLVKSYAMLAAAGKAEEVPHQPVYRYVLLGRPFGCWNVFQMCMFTVCCHTTNQRVHHRNRVTDAQRSAADAFLEVLHQHLSSFCTNLRAHTITDVQTADRVSMLLKESFVDSFPAKDRPFFKEFVETQLFSVYSDTLLN